MAKKKEVFVSPFVPAEEQPYPIPENWCWTYGSAVLEDMESQRPTGNEFDYIDIDAIDNQKQIVNNPKRLPVSKAPSRASRKLHAGDTVFSLVRPYLKNIAYIDDSLVHCIASTGFFVCTPKVFLNSRYLYQLMISPYMVDGLNQYMKGDNSPSIRKDDIEQFPFPLPPLPEQHRIVARIESLFAKLDEAKEKAQAVVDGFELRKSAILHKAFTGELTERWRKEHPHEKIDDKYLLSPVMDSECPCKLPLTWKWVRMGSLGYTNIGLTYKPSDKSEEGTIVLRSSNIQNGQIDYQDIVRVSVDIPDNKMSQKGDILICARNGSKALVGKVAIIDKDGMSYGAFMAIFRSEFNSAIYYFLISPFFRNIIDNDVGTTTINQVTQAIIKNLPYPLAPEAEMEEIVRILDVLINKERQALAAAEAVLSQIDTMKKAILARAFRGELGTNDPKEEWAGELVKKAL